MINFLSRLIAQVDPDTVRIVTQDNNLRPITRLKPSFYLTTILNILLGAAGVFSFIFLLWGGLQWIMAGGDKEAIEKARKKIIGALIGLIIVFSSYVILYTVRVLFNVNLIQVPLVPISSTVGGGSGGGGSGGGGGGGGIPPGCSTTCGCSGGGHALINEVGPLTFGGDCYTCTASGWSTPIIPAGSYGCTTFINCSCP